MKANADKTNQADRSRANANHVSRSRGIGAFGFEDNRPEAKTLQRLQLKITNGLGKLTQKKELQGCTQVVQLGAYSDNLEVQGLKEAVNSLGNHIKKDTLNTLTLPQLVSANNAVSKSIKLRTKLTGELGSDSGHAARIVIETGFQTAVKAEIERRLAAKDEVNRQAEKAKLAAAPSLLLPSSTWGRGQATAKPVPTPTPMIGGIPAADAQHMLGSLLNEL